MDLANGAFKLDRCGAQSGNDAGASLWPGKGKAASAVEGVQTIFTVSASNTQWPRLLLIAATLIASSSSIAALARLAAASLSCIRAVRRAEVEVMRRPARCQVLYGTNGALLLPRVLLRCVDVNPCGDRPIGPVVERASGGERARNWGVRGLKGTLRR